MSIDKRPVREVKKKLSATDHDIDHPPLDIYDVYVFFETRKLQLQMSFVKIPRKLENTFSWKAPE